MDYTFLKSALQIAHINFKENEPLAPKTTFKVGGTTDLFLIPDNVEQFRSCIGAIAAAEIPYFILGGGSNVVFPDESFKGAVISTQKLNNIIMTDDSTSDIKSNEVLVTCEAGTPTATFVNFCTNHNLSGAEQFAGLPGSIGGAVFMNARCFEKSISDILYQTEHIEFEKPTQSKFVTMPFDNSQWNYKLSPFQKIPSSGIQNYVTSATFKLQKMEDTPEAHNKIEADCKKYIAERVDKGHFKYPSAGSVFKNNHEFGAPSGKIIDNAGLRGTTIGGAQIAPFHGNFIININHATADDIRKLVNLSKTKVKELYGFDLETEIIFI